MSDLRDLPELAREVRERVVVPPYAEVSRRVRARMLRGAAGTIVTAVVLVAGVAGWQSLASSPRPQPAQPAGQTDESLWREVVEGTDAHVFEIEGADDGSIAVVWRALEQPEPTFALVIRDADGTVHGRRIVEPVSLTPVPGGWVGTHSSRAWLIPSDGSAWRELGKVTSRRAARPGDVFVRGQHANWLFDRGSGTLVPLPQLSGDIADGYVAPDGTLVTCGRRQDGVAMTIGENAGPSTPGAACVLAGNGDSVTMVGLGDSTDGGIPMTGVALADGADIVLPRLTDLLDGVSSVVVTPGGSTVITNASDGQTLVLGPPIDGLGTAAEGFVAGDRLYVTSYGSANGPIRWTDDDGRTWTETTLPGQE